MTSWWRKIAELGTIPAGSKGSWARIAALGAGVDTIGRRGSWPRIAALDLGQQQNSGSWERRLTTPDSTLVGNTWPRRLYGAGGLGFLPPQIDNLIQWIDFS